MHARLFPPLSTTFSEQPLVWSAKFHAHTRCWTVTNIACPGSPLSLPLLQAVYTASIFELPREAQDLSPWQPLRESLFVCGLPWCVTWLELDMERGRSPLHLQCQYRVRRVHQISGCQLFVAAGRSQSLTSFARTLPKIIPTCGLHRPNRSNVLSLEPRPIPVLELLRTVLS